MGNTLLLRVHGRVKLMKLDGHVVKIKAPVTVDDVRKDYPGHAVLHSEAVRRLGVRAKPLDGSIHLNPKHLYFVVEMSKLENYRNTPRTVCSGITMNAKSRLEYLILARRPVSDFSMITSSKSKHGSSSSEPGEGNRVLRLKLRLTKAQVSKMILDSQTSAEITKKLLESCLDLVESLEKEKEGEIGQKQGSTQTWKPALGSIPESSKNTEVI